MYLLHQRPQEMEILESLLAHGVRFLVIGGHAVFHYGHERPVDDLDLLVDPEPGNRKQLLYALRPFVNNLCDIPATGPNGLFTQISIAPHGIKIVDILLGMPGTDFAASFGRRELAQVGTLSLPVMALEDLLVSKSGTDEGEARDKDAEDLAELQRIMGARRS